MVSSTSKRKKMCIKQYQYQVIPWGSTGVMGWCDIPWLFFHQWSRHSSVYAIFVRVIVIWLDSHDLCAFNGALMTWLWWVSGSWIHDSSQLCTHQECICSGRIPANAPEVPGKCAGQSVVLAEFWRRIPCLWTHSGTASHCPHAGKWQNFSPGEWEFCLHRILDQHL